MDWCELVKGLVSPNIYSCFTIIQSVPSSKSPWRKFTGKNVDMANIVHRSQTVHLRQASCSKKYPKTKDDELRARRRRLYRLYTTNKDLFPIQQKNVFERVVVSKDIVKMWTVLTMCTVDMKEVSNL